MKIEYIDKNVRIQRPSLSGINRILVRFSQRLICMVMFALVTISVYGCLETSLSDQEYIQRAKDYRDKGELNSSVIELKNALQQNSDNPEARWLLGQVYLEIGNGVGAEKEFRRAIEFGISRQAVLPLLGEAMLLQEKYSQVLSEIDVNGQVGESDIGELHAIRGLAYLGQGDIENARKSFDLALDYNDNLVIAQVGQSRLAFLEQRPQDSRMWIDKALSIDPSSAEAWTILGDIERNEGDFQAADRAYTHAIDNRMGNATDLMKRALVRMANDDLSSAETDIRALERFSKRDPRTQYTKGVLHFVRKDYNEAEILFQNVLNVAPEYSPALYYLGATQYVKNNLEQAQTNLESYVNAVPHSDRAAVILAEIYLRGGDYSSAEKILVPVLDRNPDDLVVLSLMVSIARKQGNLQGTIQYLERLGKLKPDSIDTRIELSLALLVKGERSQGTDLLKNAIALDAELPEENFLLITSYLQAKEFDQALTAAQRYSEAAPANPEPWNFIGLAFLGKGETDKARTAFLTALDLAPGDIAAAHNLAALELQSGNVEKAQQYYQQTLQHKPEHLGTMLKLAELEGRRGNHTQATAWLRKASAINPDALKPRLLLGQYYLNTGQLTKTLTLVSELPPKLQENPQILLMKGKAQLAINKPSEAVATFTALIKVKPDWAQAHYLLAKAYSETGNVKKTRFYVERALQLDPEHLTSKLVLVRILELEGESEGADNLLKEIKSTQPNSAATLDLEGWLAMRRGQPGEAAKIYKKAFELYPTSKFVTDFALAQWKAGARSESVTTLTRWLDAHPDDVQARFHLANAYMVANENENAIATFSIIVEKAPNHLISLNALAWLLQEKQPLIAKQYAERALKISPRNAAVMDTLAVILMGQGETKQALPLLEEAVVIMPQAQDIQYHLALAKYRSGMKSEAQAILESLLGGEQSFPTRKKAEKLLIDIKHDLESQRGENTAPMNVIMTAFNS